MFKLSKAFIFFVPVLLIACTSVPPDSKQQQGNNDKMGKKTQNETTSVPDPMVNMDAGNQTINVPKAVLSLIERSQKQIKEGDLKSAKISLERALRISPRYPNSYYYLAKINYLEGQYAQARSLAKKSLSLGAEDNLLESILLLLGDIQESEAQ